MAKRYEITLGGGWGKRNEMGTFEAEHPECAMQQALRQRGMRSNCRNSVSYTNEHGQSETRAKFRWSGNTWTIYAVEAVEQAKPERYETWDRTGTRRIKVSVPKD